MSNTVMLSMGMLVASFLGGIIFYYIMDSGSKKDKKYQLDQFLNVIVQFILYLWAAKIILQINLFVQDPLSVLAYPSNSVHFFIATIILLVHLFLKYRKNKQAGVALFQTSSFIFLSALLLYDFFEIFAKSSVHLDRMTIVLTVLVLVYVFFYHQKILAILLIGIFLVVACGMALYQGYYMLFGFMNSPYYFLMLIILLLLYSYSMYQNKLLT